MLADDGLERSPVIFPPDARRWGVIVIDVQNDFCHPEGLMAQRGRAAAAGAWFEHLQQLVAAARHHGVHVIHVRVEHGPHTDSPVWVTRFSQARAAGAAPGETACAAGSWGAEFFSIAPLPGEAVITKHRYSAFLGTNLDQILRSKGIRTVVVTGVKTNVCVESTVRDAFQRDYGAILAADCTATDSDELFSATVTNVRRNFGLVLEAREIMAFWAAGLQDGTGQAIGQSGGG